MGATEFDGVCMADPREVFCFALLFVHLVADFTDSCIFTCIFCMADACIVHLGYQ